MSGPSSMPSRADVGDHERARRRVPTQGFVERHTGALGPAVHGNLAVAVIETDSHGDHLCGGVDQLGMHDRSRPHDHSIHSGIGQLPGVVDRANAATGLHLRPTRDCCSDRRDDRTVLR